MSTLIFGATGFIGTWLRRELQSAGHEIVAVAREALDRPAEPRTIWLQIDLAQPRVRLPDLPDVDRIIYLAIASLRDFPAGALMSSKSMWRFAGGVDCARTVSGRSSTHRAPTCMRRAGSCSGRAPLEPRRSMGEPLAAEVLAAGYADYFRTIALRLFSPWPGQVDMLIRR
jgi:nucleoside-diphosphate-sugar epimerase